MNRLQVASLIALAVAVPAAAAAGSFFSSSGRPCFTADNATFRIASGRSADYTVRIDNSAPRPDLRMQLVDDPSAADFILVDDGETIDACKGASTITTIRIDPAAPSPDLTVALSKDEQAGSFRLYVRSADFSEQDAAALFAVMGRPYLRAAPARVPEPATGTITLR